MKILTADDSATIRRIIKGTIEVLGHECLQAEDGQIAMEILEKDFSDIGLVLLDWNMPNLNGLETLTKIKGDDRFKDIPVMMVTTVSEKANIAKAIAVGATNYVTKPFSAEDLSSRIMECIGMGLDLEL